MKKFLIELGGAAIGAAILWLTIPLLIGLYSLACGLLEIYGIAVFAVFPLTALIYIIIECKKKKAGI